MDAKGRRETVRSWATSRRIPPSTAAKAALEGRLTPGAGFATWDAQWAAAHPDWRRPAGAPSKVRAGRSMSKHRGSRAGGSDDAAPPSGDGLADGHGDYAGARNRHMAAKARLVELELEAATRRADSLPRGAILKATEMVVRGCASSAFDAGVEHLQELFPGYDVEPLVRASRHVQAAVEKAMLPWARRYVEDLLTLEAGIDPATGSPLDPGGAAEKGDPS